MTRRRHPFPWFTPPKVPSDIRDATRPGAAMTRWPSGIRCPLCRGARGVAVGTAPRFVTRDRDAIYGSDLQRTVQQMGIEEVLTAFPCPWQKDYASYCTSLV